VEEEEGRTISRVIVRVSDTGVLVAEDWQQVSARDQRRVCYGKLNAGLWREAEGEIAVGGRKQDCGERLKARSWRESEGEFAAGR